MLNRLKNVSDVPLYNQAIYAYFPVGFDAQSSPWFPPWTSYFEACHLRVITEVLKFSGLNSLLWSIQFHNICRSLSWKVSLLKFLITIACDSLGHRYLFRSMIRIFQVESEKFCRRDWTRIISREKSFARKQDW